MTKRQLAAVVLAIADAAMVVAGVLVAIRRAGTGGDAVAFAAGPGLPVGTTSPPTTSPAPPGSPAVPAQTGTTSATATAIRPAAPPAAPAAPVGLPSKAAVRDRPWPDRAKASGTWAAHLSGTGDAVAVYAPSVVPGGVAYTSVGLTSSDPRPQTARDGTVYYPLGTALAVPGGTRWYALDSFRLEGDGDVALAGASIRGNVVSAPAQTGWLGGVLGGSSHVATGRFMTRDGQEASRIDLPAGTRVSKDCAGADPGQPPVACGGPDDSAPGLTITAPTGLRLEISGSAGSLGNLEGGVEVELAGNAHLEALGRSWDGLTGSLEANDLKGSVVRGNGGWTVTASSRSTRQVWVDVWPVVDTVFTAQGEFRTRNAAYPLRLKYANKGAATAQIFEIEVVGGGTAPIDLGINATGTHDAGLGVHRGNREINAGSGLGIDSHVPPGATEDRGVSYRPVGPVTLVIRGNFPEVRVTMPVPAAPT